MRTSSAQQQTFEALGRRPGALTGLSTQFQFPALVGKVVLPNILRQMTVVEMISQELHISTPSKLKVSRKGLIKSENSFKAVLMLVKMIVFFIFSIIMANLNIYHIQINIKMLKIM